MYIYMYIYIYMYCICYMCGACSKRCYAQLRKWQVGTKARDRHLSSILTQHQSDGLSADTAPITTLTGQ